MSRNLAPWGWTQQSQVIIDTLRMWDESYAKYLETLRAMRSHAMLLSRLTGQRH